MKKPTIFVLVTILATACQESVEPQNTPSTPLLSAAENQVTQSSNEFAFHFFQKIQSETPENSFISPLSVSMALGMLMNGADEDTQNSILQTIDYSDFTASEVNQGYKDITTRLLSTDNKVHLGLANSIWNNEQYHVNQTFTSTIRQYYDGNVQALNFGSNTSKDIINSWVENKTNKRIKNLIDDISQDEIIYVVNAIYFKGNWTYQFDKSKTHPAPFTTIHGSTTTVDMMFSKGVRLNYFSNSDLQVLDIPYGNGQFNFTVLIPNHPDQLGEIASNLSAGQLSNWLSQSDSMTIELEMPRFNMNWKNDIKGTLEKMGMKMSGFPHLFEQQLPLAISRVLHQTYLDVNEEGSEAAAATAVGIKIISEPSKPQRITIDKPFLFMIREKHTDVILFIGQLVDPELLN